MFGLGAGELVLILVICIMFFGSKKIPALAKGMGQAISEFNKAKNSDESDTKNKT